MRAFRADDIEALAESRAAAILAAGDARRDGRAALERALRIERRRKGGPDYDLLRHAGLIRRLKRLRLGGSH